MNQSAPRKSRWADKIDLEHFLLFFTGMFVLFQRVGGLSNGCGCTGHQTGSAGEAAGGSLAGQEAPAGSRLRYVFHEWLANMRFPSAF